MVVIDLRERRAVHWLKLDGRVDELFDVAVLPGVRCASSVGPEVSELETVVSFDPRMGGLVPPAPAAR